VDNWLTLALYSYTQAIDNGPQNDKDFIRDTYRKRAYANLTCERFQNAKDDALASCSGGEQDARSYYTAGKAAYALREYSKSKEYFEKALRVSPNDLRCGKDLLEALARIDEEQNGIYDFEKMSLSVTDQHIYLDHADYSAETKIGDTEHAGRGLFATQDLPAGGLVLCEKAFCLPDVYSGDEPNDMVLYNFNNNSRTQKPAQTALFLQLVQKLYNNPHLAPQYFDLDGGKYIRAGKEGTLVDGVPVIDT
jgi:tetratricopeptide (TPR) repeat protein